jgi:poly-gamma-glutamate capsule biosynthesis protein CapA/YwtB (metallophosphatase superfamily)
MKALRHFFVFIFILIFVSNIQAFPKKNKKSPTGNKITLAALGDCIISHKLSVKKDIRFLNMVKLIRNADCTWANCEGPILHTSDVYPTFKDKDINIFFKPWAADEFKWLGIDLMGMANNHTLDYGYEGLFSTMEALGKKGIGYAGAGKDLEEAASPKFIDTPAGRISQVSCCGSFREAIQAAPSHPYINGRPGLNPLRIKGTLQVRKELYEAIKEMDEEIWDFFGFRPPQIISQDNALNSKDQKEKKKAAKEEVLYKDWKMVPGNQFDLTYEINKEDLNRITGAIKVARRNSRLVIASNHDHSGEKKQTVPAKYLQTFARACIDAGADVYIGTGPHRVWGIEIYKNKPIFYSIGNFIMQCASLQYPSQNYINYNLPPDTLDSSLLEEKILNAYFQDDSYWESIIPVITYKNENELDEIRLYPIVLGKNEPFHRQGTPQPADPKTAKIIIEKLAKMSEPYKTKIKFKNGIGVIKLK